MEINARIYAVAESRDLLEMVHETLSEKTGSDWFSCETVEPCAVLPLTRTLYGYKERAEPTDGAEDWLDCLEECAGFLKKRGMVLVEFWSPDHPDSYHEYAYTTTGGSAGCSERYAAIRNMERALGNQDFSLVLHELQSGRSARDRFYASRRKNQKEADRIAKGDFEISADGVLVKYRGLDETVVLPDGIREIGESAFVDDKGVERLILYDEDYDAPPMQTLFIPDSVEKIGFYAMAYCLNLVEVDIPDSVRQIGPRAFEGCESLKKIRLSGSLTEIDENTFFLCENLKSIEIPEGVTQIRDGAFWGCGKLRKVFFPSSLKKIESAAFSNSYDLEKVYLPEGTEVADQAFPKSTEIRFRK